MNRDLEFPCPKHGHVSISSISALSFSNLLILLCLSVSSCVLTHLHLCSLREDTKWQTRVDMLLNKNSNKLKIVKQRLNTQKVNDFEIMLFQH